MFRRIILVPLLLLVAAASVTAQLFQVNKHSVEKPLVFLNFATEEPPLVEAPSEEECNWEVDTELCVKRLLETEGDKKMKRGWQNLIARLRDHTLYWKDNLSLWNKLLAKNRHRIAELKETKEKERENLKLKLKETLLRMEEEEKKKEEEEEKKLKESPGLEGLRKDELRRKLRQLKRKIRAEWQKRIKELELTMNAMLAQI